MMLRAVGDLPEPNIEAQEHSRRLSELILAEIDREGGSIGFDRYMEIVLYQPGQGYYSAGKDKFGRYGDFVTAPQVSSLFSQCLARQCEAILQHISGGSILELGAGTGVMAADVLEALEGLGRIPERYYILELSAELRQRQDETLKGRVPHLYPRVTWLDTLPQTRFRGVVLGNEVLDAMPALCFRLKKGVVFERRVTFSAKGHFIWTEQTAGPTLKTTVEHIMEQLPEALPADYCSEVNLRLRPWVKAMGAILEQAVMILIDYGYPRHDYYHPQRYQGTLLCHYRHLAHDDPFFYPGLQDISTNVDFTAVAEAADDAEMCLLGYTSQAQFLLSNGLDKVFCDVDDQRLQLEYSQQIKRLTMPSEMGERFQVIALGKAFDKPLQGFGLRDLRSRL
jgi:SAM-dependent MidA family methyltransferase